LVCLVNWKARPVFIQLLLCLCGDIHLNPGPDIFPSGYRLLMMLKLFVVMDAIDGVMRVVHDQYTTVQKWLIMRILLWILGFVVSARIYSDTNVSCQSPKHDLQCICLNARSLFPKRYDLLGYLSAI